MLHDATLHPLPPGFRWPEGVRAAALFSFDLDAEAVMLGDHPETGQYLDVIAHQRYGPKVAVPRILRMLDRLRLRTTFFIPGWVAETWHIHIPSIFNACVALSIAVVKAVLVFAFFMQLRYDNPRSRGRPPVAGAAR